MQQQPRKDHGHCRLLSLDLSLYRKSAYSHIALLSPSLFGQNSPLPELAGATAIGRSPPRLPTAPSPATCATSDIPHLLPLGHPQIYFTQTSGRRRSTAASLGLPLIGCNRHRGHSHRSNPVPDSTRLDSNNPKSLSPHSVFFSFSVLTFSKIIQLLSYTHMRMCRICKHIYIFFTKIVQLEIIGCMYACIFVLDHAVK